MCPIESVYGKDPDRVGLSDLQKNESMRLFIQRITASCMATTQDRIRLRYLGIQDFWNAMEQKRTIWHPRVDRFSELIGKQIAFFDPTLAQSILERRPKTFGDCPVSEAVIQIISERSQVKPVGRV